MPSREIDSRDDSALRGAPPPAPNDSLSGREGVSDLKGEEAAGPPRDEAARNNMIEALKVLLQVIIAEVESLRKTPADLLKD
jgi:hypothetical protein